MLCYHRTAPERLPGLEDATALRESGFSRRGYCSPLSSRHFRGGVRKTALMSKSAATFCRKFSSWRKKNRRISVRIWKSGWCADYCCCGCE